MKIVGLITEYNPFHNGHKYHIEKALELTNSDAAVVIMSGDFVQRGAPAIMPKHLRAEMALSCGASVVLELPVCYAAGSAEYFASGAVSVLNALGIIDSICFGSECGDIHALSRIADILSQEPSVYQDLLQQFLKSGHAFPLARQKAIAQFTGDSALADMLGKPNNTLAVEYLKALNRMESSMKPYTISRAESEYHEETLCETYSSASAIRKVLLSNKSLDPLETQVPDAVLSLFEKNRNCRFPVVADDFSLLLKYKLLTETNQTLTRYADVTPELANRIMNQRNAFSSWMQFCDLLKTREVTFTRISRILLHILLGITKEQMMHSCLEGYTGYARILGFQKKDTEILSLIKKSASIPLITKLGKDYGLSDSFKEMLQMDLFAADLYESVLTDKFQTAFVNEYQKQLIIL